MFANIPRYLYDHLRGESTLQHLARDLSVAELVQEYEGRIGRPERSAEDIAVAYAVLVAITFLEYDEAMRTFSKLDLSQLDWGIEIEKIFQFLATSTHNFTFTVPPQPTVSVGMQFLATSSNNFTFTIPPQTTVGVGMQSQIPTTQKILTISPKEGDL